MLKPGDRRVVISGSVVDGVRDYINRSRSVQNLPPIRTDSGVLAAVLLSYQHNVMMPALERERKLIEAKRRYNAWADKRESWQRRLREGPALSESELRQYQNVMAEDEPGED